MSDRYERIRAALAMGPTPGPWVQDGDGVTADDEDVAVAMCCPSDAEAAYIAACDPDTIRELLEGRDALEAEIEALRAEVETLRALAGCAYQMAGMHDAPLVWLDRLSEAANGDALPDADTLMDELLPYQPDAVCEAEARAERLAEVLRELRDLMLGQVKWAPCDCGCPQQRTPDGPHSVTWLRAAQQVEIAISKAEGKE